MASLSQDVVLHAPDVHNPPIDLDLQKFMGTWHVVYSTLPLWTSKKDVTITYALKPSSSASNELQFDDTVEYRAKSALATSSRSRVTGVDTLQLPQQPAASEGAASTASPPAPTRYKWRGKGWLSVATSRWQVLGCSRDTSPDNPDAWAVTYFEKTLFTPQGLDIYARTPKGLPEELVTEIVGRAKALGGDVGKLAEAFFEVERSGMPPGKAVSGTGRRIGSVNKIDVLNHVALSPS
ncbi:hypothetical protein BV20DRAFT_1017829 [Pilatotrama ljubarskyi]|nr:hypothetical protein BV20DRAFT_1017829 [Pilatotrama ljubarskyi]